MFTHSTELSIGFQRTSMLFLVTAAHLYSEPAWAICSNTNPSSNAVVTCSGVNTNVLVNALPGSSSVTLNIQPSTSLTAQHTSAVSLALLSVETASMIDNQGSLGLTNSGGSGTHRGAAMLANGDGNQLVNRQGASIVNSGGYNDGMAANGSNNILSNEGYIETSGPNAYGMTAAWGQTNSGVSNNQLINTGKIVTSGSNARGISIIGQSSQVINQGSVSTSGSSSPAIYMQGDNDQLVNSGHIETTGNGSDAVFSNTAGNTFSAQLENQAGGQIISQQAMGIRTLNGSTTLINAGLIRGATNAIGFGNGNDTLILQTGSMIDGIADGGNGTNSLLLQGSGTAENPFTNFQTLLMQGDHWIWQGIGAFDQISMATGQFQLAGTITGISSSVSTGAILSGQGTLIGNVFNQGTIQPGTGQANGQLTIQGNYHGDHGSLLMNSILGNDSSPANRLIIDRGTADGMTQIQVVNLNGQGAQTIANGILLVQAVNGASTDSASFQLNGRVVAGAYEYDLYRGGFDGAMSENNWYLRSIGIPTPPNPVPPGSPYSPDQKPTPRPETGGYLRNMTAASGMFMHTLHTRLGEPQYTDMYKNSEEDTTTSSWVRLAGSHTDSRAGSDEIDLNTNTTLVHLGGDLARWSSNGENRWLFGLMGAYGHSETNADPIRVKKTNNGYKRTASGTVAGYGAGAYLTWYGNKDKPTGPYVDLWGMYGWYDNTVQGNGLQAEKYDSTGWTASIEGGYAFIVYDGEKRQWMIEPQAQVAYNSYSADDHYERDTNTWIRKGNSDGMIGRLGARLYSRSKLGDNGIQPFIEANWWYDSAQYDLRFNGQSVSDDTPRNTYELKAGLQGDIAKSWQLWGHIGERWGADNYRRYEGMVGIKKRF